MYEDESITVNSARKPGVHFGEAFRPGVTINMYAATTDKMESMRRALLQETAHHLERIGEACDLMARGFHDPGKRPITQYAANAGWREYFAESFVAHFVEPEALQPYDPTGSYDGEGSSVSRSEVVMRMPEPNMDAIRDIATRAEEISRSGKMDRTTWRALLSEAYAASNGRPDLTAFLAPYAKSAWVHELREEERTDHRSVA